MNWAGSASARAAGSRATGAAIGVASTRPAANAASAIKVATGATPDTHVRMAVLPIHHANHIEFGTKLQAKPFPRTLPGRSPYWRNDDGQLNREGPRPSTPTRKAASPAPAIRFPA